MIVRQTFVLVMSALLASCVTHPAPDDLETGRLRFVPDQADAVLTLLETKHRGAAPSEAAWGRLLASEGYRRLKEREASVGRPFTDQEFLDFVNEPELQKRYPALANTLLAWKRADLSEAAARARAYLPAGTPISATVYPVIKPRDNSFVFDVRNRPSIFLYLDPKLTEQRFSNIVAHELHHVGLASACSTEAAARQSQPPALQEVARWFGAFGEGIAVLAAAGSPQVHPEATGSAEERARWNRDIARFDHDFQLLVQFFLDIKNQRLSGAAIAERAGGFYGERGPWYTVGWRMAATIEEVEGRAVLVRSLCNPGEFMAAYNRAAVQKALPLWPKELIEVFPVPEGILRPNSYSPMKQQRRGTTSA